MFRLLKVGNLVFTSIFYNEKEWMVKDILWLGDMGGWLNEVRTSFYNL